MTWEATPTPGGWVYKESDSSARIILDYLTPRGSALEAWVELRVGEGAIPLASGTRNIMAPDAAKPFLAGMDNEQAAEWRPGLQQAFYETIEAWREGSATVDLAHVEATEMVFYVEPLIEQGGNTRLIAPGGSGKSLLALAIGLTVATGSKKFLGLSAQQTGPVLYLDWETDAATHARRIRALCKPAGVPFTDGLIHYRPEALPLHKTMQAVHRAADREGAVMLVVDSRAVAAGASGQSSGEDSTLNLNMALREIGRPALIVDHKAKEDIAKGRKGGYGSVFNQNLARMEWEFTKYQKLGENDHVFTLSLEKQNNVGFVPPLGYRLTTDGGTAGITEAVFTRVRPETIVDPVGQDSLAEQILLLFTTATEPMVTSKIATMVDKPESSVRSALNRDTRFVNLNEGQKGKPGYWRPKDEYLDTPQDDGVQTIIDQLEPMPEDEPVSVPDHHDDEDVF